MKFHTLTLLASLMVGTAASAAITGPYTVDANTLHLWHMDTAASATPVNTPDAVSPGGVPVSNQSDSTWGNPSYAVFGTAGNTSAAENSIIRSSATTLRNVPVGVGGAFTFEAMINVSTFDGGQHIFSMDQDGAVASRPFHWRIINGSLNFNNISASSSHNVLIPTTGDDAFVANQWFHVAVTYNGNENTAENLKFYWTRVDASRTQANLVGSVNMTADLAGTAVYGIGNAFRTVGGGVTQNLEGSIDEVRISGVARGADEFIFTVPEPGSLALLGLGGLLIARRRRA